MRFSLAVVIVLFAQLISLLFVPHQMHWPGCLAVPSLSSWLAATSEKEERALQWHLLGGWGHRGYLQDGQVQFYPPEKHGSGAVCGAVRGPWTGLLWAARNLKLEHRVIGRQPFLHHCTPVRQWVKKLAQRLISRSPEQSESLCVSVLHRVPASQEPPRLTSNLAEFFFFKLMSNISVWHGWFSSYWHLL